MKSQPQFLNDWRARLWCRFFLLSVFATMYLNDVQRSGFYESIGLDAKEYDTYVIQKTNETAGRVFPVILNVNHPDFMDIMENASNKNLKLAEVGKSNAPGIVKLIKKVPLIASIGVDMLRLYLMKPIDTAKLEGTVR